MQLTPPWASTNKIPALRLLIGLVQGITLLVLYQTAKYGVWPARNLYVFLPLVQLGMFLPLTVMVSLGHVAMRPLLIWLGVLALVIVGLDAYTIYRFDLPLMVLGTISANVDATGEAAIPTLFFFLPIALLIAHTLFVAHQTTRTYENYFERAWNHGIQVAAAGAFTGVFWLLLLLGGGLFKLIKIEAVWEVFQDARFAIPATALVVALALHVTDVRPGIVAGMRTLALTLLSWLLPVLVILIVSFLVVLPFAGFDLLWSTNIATGLLLASSAALVILINAVYQDGPPRTVPPKALQLAASASAVALVPLALLAGYGLGQRVAQYGWTADRLIAAACVLVTAGYAGGYAFSVIKRGPWLQFIERVNIAMSFVALAVLLGLFSPLADPARISVGNQLERLKDGRTSPIAFDVSYLRFDAGRYGLDALKALIADNSTDPSLKDRAVAILAQKTRFADSAVLAPAVIAANIRVLPEGRVLPDSFLRQDWLAGVRDVQGALPGCLIRASTACHALMVDLDRDGAEEIVLTRGVGGPWADVFKLTGERWESAGQVASAIACSETVAALRPGPITTAPSLWDDIVVGDSRFPVQPALKPQECR